MKPPKPVDKHEFAERVIDRWYAMCPEEHDQLSRDGMDWLMTAIANSFEEHQELRPVPVRRKARRKP